MLSLPGQEGDPKKRTKSDIQVGDFLLNQVFE